MRIYVLEPKYKHRIIEMNLVKMVDRFVVCDLIDSLIDVYELVKGNIDFIEKEMESIQDAVYFVQDNLQKEHDALLETLNNKYLREKNK